MKQTKGAIGNLINRYRAVLKKCHLLNTFGSLAVIGLLVAGNASTALAEPQVHDGVVISYTGSELLSQTAQNENLSYTLNDDNSVTVTSTEQTSSKYGVISNIYKNGTADDISNVGLTIINSTFRNNKNSGSGSGGGAVSLWSKNDKGLLAHKIINSIFSGNTAENGYGGAVAVFNWDTSTEPGNTLFIEGSTFEKNSANYGGAIATDTFSIITDSITTFTENTATRDGGAISIRKGGDVIVNGSTFKENTSERYGGAIAGDIEGTAKLTVNSGTFIGNEADAGGAIALWTTKGDSAPKSVINGTFIGNKADRKGGAIVLLSEDDWTASNVSISGTFTDNSAGETGGAVLIENSEATLKNTNFSGNSAGYNGGAVYVAANADLTMSGTNTFANNTVAETPNDMYNAGAVTIADGITTLGSGYVQAGSDNPSFTVSDGATLQSNGTMDIQAGKVTFEDNSNFIADASRMTGGTSAIVLHNGTEMTVGSSANLVLSNVVADQEYSLVDTTEGGTINSNWQSDNIVASSSLIDLSIVDGKVTSTVKDAAIALPGLSSELADQVIGITALDKQINSDFAGVRFLALATDAYHGIGYDAKAAVSTIESAARIAFAGAVPQMTKMASDAATNAVVNRLGFANPENGAKAMSVDGKLVDDKALGLALWIAPLWSNQTGFGMEAGNLDYGYNANLGGVSLGADYTWANNIRAGLMFNIGGGYAESSGDLSETTNSMTFWGVGAYGGWEYNNFAVMADVSYTSTWNSVDQDLDHRMGMGDLEADIQASAISAGLRFEYKLETQYLDFIPHVGARYMSINTWGYDVDSADGTILEGDGFHQNIWTFPVGITFSKELEMNNDWYFKPSVDFTVIPAAGDIKAKEDVRFTGPWANTAEIETQMMDYFTWQGGVGLEFGNDNMSVGVNYTLQAGQNSTGHGVFGMFRYEF